LPRIVVGGTVHDLTLAFADLVGALARFRAALVRAWEVCGDRESLSLRIAEPKAMGFQGLRRLVVPDG